MKPILKWAGGKRQLLKVILNELPKKFNSYFEPFFGGGALFFELLPKTAYINDINDELINLYRIFQSPKLVLSLIQELRRHEQLHSKDFYYQIRELDRSPKFKKLSKVKRAARILYLNKACFNGLYRVNSKGFFNVPFNGKDKVKLFDSTNFQQISDYFKVNSIKLFVGDFAEVLKNARKGDFVYLDPPYDFIEEKSSFTAYAKENFTQEDQTRLSNICIELNNKGVFWLLSNHDTKNIRNLFKNFNIKSVKANRLINSDASKRDKIEEVLIKNY
jgi:DNA adenine methylase